MISNNLLSKLINLGIHIGDLHYKTSSNYNDFLLGHRHDYEIIDIYKTLLYLRRAMVFVREIGMYNSTILFHNSKLYLSDLQIRLFFINLIVQYHDQALLDEQWSFGQLSNNITHSRIMFKRLFSVIQTKYNYYSHMRWVDLLVRIVHYIYYKRIIGIEWNLHFKHMYKYWRFLKVFKFFKMFLKMPDICTFVNPNNYSSISVECSSIGMPSICLADSNNINSNSSYIIPGNDDSIIISSLFFNLILNTKSLSLNNKIYNS
jgi:ribosomal protein S2